jgi:hypothetical protein
MAAMPAVGKERLDRSGYELEFDEPFAGTSLDRSRWLPWYLPHWSSRAATEARYVIGEGVLRLRIDEDTPPWSPEFDPGVRVSNLQTALGSGPVGSGMGPHRFRPGLIVREAQAPDVRYAPRYGLVEVRLAASRDPRCLTALWLIGLEDVPERSGELCIVELFGRDVAPDGSVVGLGIHPFGDPQLVEDFRRVPVAFDAAEPHTYAAAWQPGRTDWYVDDVHVASQDQAPDYPLLLMLDLYELPGEDGPEARIGPYPKEAVVHHVRGYRRRSGASQRAGGPG